jgi:tetratricopeptide (TPR) repeat protein
MSSADALSEQSIEEVARVDLARACELARDLVAAKPFDEEAAELLRIVVERLGAETAPAADPNAHLPPDLAEASRLLAAGNKDEEAEVILREYVAQHPRDVRAMAMMGEIAGRCDFFDDASRIFARALQIDPNSIDALLGMAKLLNHISYIQHAEDRGDEALKLLQQALVIDPSENDVISLYSSILLRFRRVKEAVIWYQRLLKLQPTHWLAWLNYAVLLNGVGDFGAALAGLRTSAALNPRFGSAWWEIANLKTSKLFGSDVRRMERLVGESELDAQSRAHIHFALAKAYDQSHRYEEAIAQLELGNAIKCELEAYDSNTVSSDVANSKRIFTPEFFEQRRGQGDLRPDPIFIIGMQRGGTTLVEQILSSHSQIEGTEELFHILQLGTEVAGRHLGRSWQEGLALTDAHSLREIGETYLQWSARNRTTNRPLFIDKNPSNWRFTGLMATILPNAKIVDVRRNPLDCCFANYSQHYENGIGFSYSLKDTGRYYSDYVDLMRHFATVAPGRIHKLIYDDLVDDLEGNVRSLLDYIGVPFEDACLRFYETDRPVLTPSSQQVRQPINRKGFDRWRNYDPWLGELREALAGTLDDWRS